MLAARHLIGIAHDALTALAREDARLQCDLLRRARIEARADVCVLALTVLADDDHVDVLALDAGERARSALEQFDGAQVDVLVEAAANLQQQLPERDVVGHARIADRTKVDGIKCLELLKAVFRHHLACLEVVLAAPGEVRELDGKRSIELCNA